ncbi:HNH endonuclease [Leptospira neocaledonica]|uniref:HNH endonuclease 5 domain-containing protein n=1 Tax=Leptospira neocaledonica TaxID=2023192 RepID=A0A2M9ZZD5_9LEPT|nr:HNH endonuclease [Leptospira neocaledonica]PJZ77434.1 hypothetical protein CH365_07560 [Leptospira neocaledonica]
MDNELIANFRTFQVIGPPPANTKCVICKNSFTSKNSPSSEHLFPESIGGTITIDKLYCKKCNSKLGNEVDRELFTNFQFISTVLNVKRSTNNPLPNMKLRSHSGKEFVVKPGGRIELHSLVEDEIRDGKRNLIVRANTEKEILKKAKEVSQSLMNKGKTFNISEFKKLDSTLVYEEELNNFRLDFTTGKHSTLLSILKTAFSYALSLNIPLEFMDHIPMILRREIKQGSIVIPYIYPPLTPDPIVKEDVSHSILLIGLPEEKILFAVIELFSSFKYFVLLSSRYAGTKSSAYISQNSITGRKNDVPEFSLLLEKYIRPEQFTLEDLTKAFGREFGSLRRIIDRILYSQHIGKTMDFDFGPFKKGNLVTENEVDSFLKNRPELHSSVEFL